MRPQAQPHLIVATHVAATLTGLVGLTALAVHLCAAARAREFLGFQFAGLPRDIGTATDIFANNVRVLAAVLALCGIAQLARLPGEAAWERRLFGFVTGCCDGAVAAGCAVHILLIGTAFGAYGERILGAVLAHGPFELAAFSLALALYVRGRRERLRARRVATTALAATATLAIGAVLEVFA